MKGLDSLTTVNNWGGAARGQPELHVGYSSARLGPTAQGSGGLSGISCSPLGLSEAGEIAHHAGVAGERCSGTSVQCYRAAEALPVAQGALCG